MALINPYDTTVTQGANTGFEGNVALGVAKGLFIVNASDTWTDSDMSDVSTFVKNRIHAAGSTRWYPILQGIFDFAVAKESEDDDISDFSGLVDTDIIKAAAASTTKLKISVRTRDGKTDLIAKYGSALADLDLFIVTDKASGVVVTPTAIAVASGFLELTGT